MLPNQTIFIGRLKTPFMLFLAVLGFFLAQCNSKSGNAPAPLPAVSADVGPAGATLQTADGRAKLVIPPGALSVQTTLTIQSTQRNIAGFNMLTGTAYDFGPEGIQFEKPVQLTFQYDPSAIPVGVEEAGLSVVKIDDSLLPETVLTTDQNIKVDADANQITAEISGFSTHGVAIGPCCWPDPYRPAPEVRVTDVAQDSIVLAIKRHVDPRLPSPNRVRYVVQHYMGPYRTHSYTDESAAGNRYPVSAVCFPRQTDYLDENCQEEICEETSPRCRIQITDVEVIDEIRMGGHLTALPLPTDQIFVDDNNGTGLRPNVDYNHVVYACYDYSGIPSNSPYYTTTLHCSRYGETTQPTRTLESGPLNSFVPSGQPTVQTVPSTSIVSVHWSSVPYAQNYRVEYSSDGGATWILAGEVQGLSTSVSGLTPATAYLFRLTPQNNAGTGNATVQPATTLAGNGGGSSGSAGTFNGIIGANQPLAAGLAHALTLSSIGEPIAWGDNSHGQIGDNSTTNRTSASALAFALPPGTSVRKVVAGRVHSALLLSDGTVWTWGDNLYGQLGVSRATTPYRSYPVQVMDPIDPSRPLTGISDIVSGNDHMIARELSGQVIYTWGRNHHGQLGIGSTVDQDIPQPLIYTSTPGTGGRSWTLVYAAGDFGYALLSSGASVSWGANSYGQLCNGTSADTLVPGGTRLPSGVQLALGINHTLAIEYPTLGTPPDSTAPVYVCGDNTFGQLGLGASDTNLHLCGLTDNRCETALTEAFRPAGVGANATTIWAGYWHSIIKTPAGPMSFGRNGVGALGRNPLSVASAATPTLLEGPIAAENIQGCALGFGFSLCSSETTLYGFGENSGGQLGNPNLGLSVPVAAPVQ